MIREGYYSRISKLLATNPLELSKWRSAYESGDYEGAVTALDSYAPTGPSGSADWQAEFEKRLTLRVSNPSPIGRSNEPIVVDLTGFKKYAKDFNASNFAVYLAQRQITDRELPSQADDLDGDGTPDELVFVANFRPQEKALFHIYYSPSSGPHAATASPTDVYARNNTDGLLQWGSGKVSYQLFQQKLEFHIDMPTGENVTVPIEEADIGEVKSSNKVFSIHRTDPRGRSARVVANGPVRATAAREFNVVLNNGTSLHVKERFSTYSRQPYSENHFELQPGNPGHALWLNLASLRNLTNENFFDSSGEYFGSWYRKDSVTQEVGSAVVLLHKGEEILRMPTTNQVMARLPSSGKLTWYSIGDWRRARTFPVAPTISNWRAETAALADRLRVSSTIQFVKQEQRSPVAKD